eukprot:TRINITY_DN17532_c1_g1_i1.p1 TRINITY_DN17532_c1_g1~~TRINITY_DN17532_c1_g1_i1.p1  ORF type:complete len:386 (-),score=32.23 TRINITY_DN17532_c1_g1_i1:680-1837(-)
MSYLFGFELEARKYLRLIMRRLLNYQVFVRLFFFIVTTKSQETALNFPEWNPFLDYCQYLFRDKVGMNISYLTNNANNEIIVLDCGEHYVGAAANPSSAQDINLKFDLSQIHDYQRQFIDDEVSYLQSFGFPMSEETVIMDNGADVSGAPLSYLVSKFGCKAVGYNIFGFYTENQIPSFVYTHQNVSIVLGNVEKRIPFKQNVFDIVLSANILEHVGDYQRYLNESIRVLKPGGGLYITWGPQFYGMHGSHIHPDMLITWWEEYNCPGDSQEVLGKKYGGWVGPWDHLLLNQFELKWKLQQGPLGACQKVIDELVSRVYCHSDINRLSYEDVLQFLHSQENIDVLMEEMQILNVDDEIEKKLIEKVGEREFGVFQVRILVKKKET